VHQRHAQRRPGEGHREVIPGSFGNSQGLLDAGKSPSTVEKALTASDWRLLAAAYTDFIDASEIASGDTPRPDFMAFVSATTPRCSSAAAPAYCASGCAAKALASIH
jgi:hypothetical protein